MVEVTITSPDADCLCRQLVDARLASSAHVIHPITSIYRWDGEVHQAVEARAFLRSRHDLLDDWTAFVVERHPHDVPNVAPVPIAAGDPEYLAWIRAETVQREPQR